MTITHLSHFGMTLVAETDDNVVFSGKLADCRRMAFSHGLEIDRYEGQTISSENGKSIQAPADANKFVWAFFKQGGFILKGRDDWSLLMPKAVWLAE